ncbi:MAG: Gfo/Idh/MocA family oxidoreductase [Bacteroidota bacterium]
MRSESHSLRIGILGCGPIAQFAHFESAQKAYNVELHSICDLAEDLLERMGQIWRPQKMYKDYDQMLKDEEIDAIIIATADPFHVPLSIRALEAGKHVLVEKPLTHSLEECSQIEEIAEKTGKIVQVGHMKRFDPGIRYAKDFIQEKMGEVYALKAWYGDNTHRYTATNNLQPLAIKSGLIKKPAIHPKANLERYYMMAHGSHLLDTALYLGGEIGAVQSRFLQKSDFYSWFVDLEYKHGGLGHLDLSIKLRGDWHEGFQIYGEQGSINGKTYNPWFYKSSEVECFWEEDQTYYRPLGADGFSYRRQLEHFAEVILKGKEALGTSIQEARTITKAMIAIKRSVDTGQRLYLDEIQEGAL